MHSKPSPRRCIDLLGFGSAIASRVIANVRPLGSTLRGPESASRRSKRRITRAPSSRAGQLVQIRINGRIELDCFAAISIPFALFEGGVDFKTTPYGLTKAPKQRIGIELSNSSPQNLYVSELTVHLGFRRPSKRPQTPSITLHLTAATGSLTIAGDKSTKG